MGYQQSYQLYQQANNLKSTKIYVNQNKKSNKKSAQNPIGFVC